MPLPASEGHRACAGCEAGISLAAIWLGALFLPSLWQILKIKPENVEVLKGCAAPEPSLGFSVRLRRGLGLDSGVLGSPHCGAALCEASLGVNGGRGGAESGAS